MSYFAKKSPNAGQTCYQTALDAESKGNNIWAQQAEASSPPPSLRQRLAARAAKKEVQSIWNQGQG